MCFYRFKSSLALATIESWAPDLLSHYSVRSRVQFILSLGLILTVTMGLTACPSSHKNRTRITFEDDRIRDSNTTEAEPEYEEGPVHLSEDGIDISCGSGECRKSAGLIMMLKNLKNKNGMGGHRCGGTLIAPDFVLSNGHCDYMEKGFSGYFIRQTTGLPRSEIFRKIEGIAYKAFTPGENDRSSGRMDVVIFKLEKPFSNITPADITPIARGPQVDYKKLIGFVPKLAKADTFEFRMERIECNVREDDSFPIQLSESPDVFHAFDCKIEKGMSGTGLVSENGGDLEAVVQGMESPESKQGDLAEVTNLRCLEDIEAKNCLHTTREEILRRLKSPPQEDPAPSSDSDLKP